MTDARDAIAEQMKQMQRDLKAMQRKLAGRADTTAEDVSEWIGDAKERAGRATDAFRKRARSTTRRIQQDPTAFSTGALVFGAAGLLIGFILGRVAGR